MAKASGGTRVKTPKNTKETSILSQLNAKYGNSWNINNFIKPSPYGDEEALVNYFKENYSQKMRNMVFHKNLIMYQKHSKTLEKIKKLI